MKRTKIISAVVIWLSLCVFDVAAQLPIEKEPNHKVVFENPSARVIDLVVKPHDTTLLHTHDAASVVIFLSASSFAIQNPKQAPVITQVKIGDVVYRDYDEKPVRHIVWSADNSIFRCLVIELKKYNGNCAGPVVDVPLLWAEKKVNVYKLHLEKTKPYSLPRFSCGYVLVSLGRIDVLSGKTKSILKEGEFVFVPSGNQTTVYTEANDSALLFQLK